MRGSRAAVPGVPGTCNGHGRLRLAAQPPLKLLCPVKKLELLRAVSEYGALSSEPFEDLFMILADVLLTEFDLAQRG